MVRRKKPSKRQPPSQPSKPPKPSSSSKPRVRHGQYRKVTVRLKTPRKVIRRNPITNEILRRKDGKPRVKTVRTEVRYYAITDKVQGVKKGQRLSFSQVRAAQDTAKRYGTVGLIRKQKKNLVKQVLPPRVQKTFETIRARDRLTSQEALNVLETYFQMQAENLDLPPSKRRTLDHIRKVSGLSP